MDRKVSVGMLANRQLFLQGSPSVPPLTLMLQENGVLQWGSSSMKKVQTYNLVQARVWSEHRLEAERLSTSVGKIRKEALVFVSVSVFFVFVFPTQGH